MFQSRNATGIDPASRTAGPSLRARRVTATGRAVPCMVSWPAAVTVTTEPAVKEPLNGTGRVTVNVATGKRRTPRLSANCGWTLPLTRIAVRSTRSRALVTWPAETMIVPVTARVRPTASLLKPSALSLTRNPATEPAATCQVPSTGPDGAGTDVAGRVSGAGADWSLIQAAAARTMSATTATAPDRTQRSQRCLRGGPA